MAQLEDILETLAARATAGGRIVRDALADRAAAGGRVVRDALAERLSARRTQRPALDAVESGPGVWEVPPTPGDEPGRPTS